MMEPQGKWHGWLVVSILLVAALVIAACSSDDPGSADAGDPGGTSDEPGAVLYETSCASCHGSDLRGTDKGPSHLSQVYAADHHSDEAFRAAVRHGSPAHHWNFGDMQPVDGLNDDEVEQIIAFIRAQQRTQGLEPYPPN